MRRIYRFASVGLAAAVVGLAPAPAFAAVPSNDTFGGATAIGSVPFDATVDNSEATTDANDVEANANCGAPATDASVWYSITPTEDTAYIVDVSQSSYLGGVIVVTGSPGSFSLETCGPDTVAFAAASGVTYYLLAFDDQSDGTGNGGTLRLHVETAPPPPTVKLTIDKTGTFDKKTGTAYISGTVFCGGVVDFGFISGELRQPVGRAIVVGFFDMEITCDGVTHRWSAEVPPFYPGTKFAGGSTVSMTYAIACGPFECSEDYREQAVKLRRR